MGFSGRKGQRGAGCELRSMPTSLRILKQVSRMQCQVIQGVLSTEVMLSTSVANVALEDCDCTGFLGEELEGRVISKLSIFIAL
jgi:hypothetical protein